MCVEVLDLLGRCFAHWLTEGFSTGTSPARPPGRNPQSPGREGAEAQVPAVQVLDVPDEQAPLVLAQVLARPQAALVLVEDVIPAGALISEEIDPFLEAGDLGRGQAQQGLRSLLDAGGGTRLGRKDEDC